jgi:hypothetical protein
MQVLFNKFHRRINKSDGTFVTYIGVQEHKKELRILKFVILWVPSTQIPTKKY